MIKRQGKIWRLEQQVLYPFIIHLLLILLLNAKFRTYGASIGGGLLGGAVTFGQHLAGAAVRLFLFETMDGYCP